ncbi:hypothetical protein M2650_10825 [Luteimonas sp. SX5]|uniref:Secretion protein n=1 Tax=Luteimonas galliterrae TaxID=2940486 RepID=A0ABT0MJR2_9GAMM|nr:TrbI/VirB10 family protein [Luteimonas galliterrae]MCL1635116.1 hypothetical protein [Luteimonas galliterrae]
MSQTNSPELPEDPLPDEAGSGYRQTAEDGDQRSSYVNERRAEHDLDAHAPQLGRQDSRRTNRLVLALVGAVGVLMAVVIGFLIFKKSDSSSSGAAQPRAENVTVPETPDITPTDAPETQPIPLEQAARDARKKMPPPEEDSLPPSAAPRAPTLMERRMGSAEVTPDAQASQAQNPYLQALAARQNEKPQENPQVKTTRAQFLSNPDALLVRGTYLRCVLETRIITDIKGFTSCIVTEPVYSINGRKLLIPKGSKISGAYDTDANGPRVSVIWDRIITPTGVDVTMSSPGVDNLGGAGHPGDYNAHWASRMSSALMISLISDAFKYAAAEHGPPSTTVTNGIVTQEPFESNTARTMERLANQALERSVNRPATVTIHQGEVVNVYVAQDIDFSAVAADI